MCPNLWSQLYNLSSMPHIRKNERNYYTNCLTKLVLVEGARLISACIECNLRDNMIVQQTLKKKRGRLEKLLQKKVINKSQHRLLYPHSTRLSQILRRSIWPCGVFWHVALPCLNLRMISGLVIQGYERLVTCERMNKWINQLIHFRLKDIFCDNHNERVY